MVSDLSSFCTQIVDTTTAGEIGRQNTFMEEVQTHMTHKIAKYINTFWFPILVPIGFVGNVLSFLVMIKPNNRKISTCIYLAAISMNDNLMMVLAFSSYFFTAASIRCKISAFLAMFALQNSTFQVLAMTIDKYIAIKWPHKAAIYSTPKRAKVTVFIILTSVFVYNIPHLIISEAVQSICVAYGIGGTITQVYSWFSFVLNANIPFIMLIYMNYTIIKKVGQSRKMFVYKDKTDDEKERNQNHNRANDRRGKSMKNTENQLTIMLLLVTTLFLILMIPTYVRFLLFSFIKRDTPEKYANLMLVYYFSYNLYNTNSGINFFLYCISGQKFRNDVKETLLYCFEGKINSEKSKSSNTESTMV